MRFWGSVVSGKWEMVYQLWSKTGARLQGHWGLGHREGNSEGAEQVREIQIRCPRDPPSANTHLDRLFSLAAILASRPQSSKL